MVTPDLNFRVKLTSVLVATDFSAASEKAVLYATAIARRHRSKLFLVHVVTSRSEGALMAGVLGSRRLRSSYLQITSMASSTS
jgi:nucleotide-binding universal stress UspA family protein